MHTGVVWKFVLSQSMQLIDIQKLQFSNKELAEKELLGFLKSHEDPSIEKIVLTPKPESLNSINGFVTYANQERYFFKSHVEENEQISEYYNASSLAKAGYPVIAAKQITHKPGKQIALYEIVSLPTLFDLIKKEEDQQIAGHSATKISDTLLKAQIELDKTVANIYANTLQESTREEHAQAPIHQLFSHRLAQDGRLGLFYRDQYLNLKNGPLSFDSLANMRWIINDVEYTQTLGQIIEQSKSMLVPQSGLTIIGHGDAHNGNIFVDLENKSMQMFDPAFAGRHHPLLDITKPLFHNIFARWMYYPEQVVKEIELSYRVIDDQIIIDHSYKPSSLRLKFLQSRIDNVLLPTLLYLDDHKSLDYSWRDYLRSALFCCPFLTVNLLAPYVANGNLSERYELPIKLLGLSMAIEFGASLHKGNSYLSELIDNIFH